MESMPSSSPTALLLFPLEGNSTGWPTDPGLCLEPCERFCMLKAKLANPGFLTALWSVKKKSYFSGTVLWVFVLSKRGPLPVKMEKVSCKWPQHWQPDLRSSEFWNWKISPKSSNVQCDCRRAFLCIRGTPHHFALSPAAGRAQKAQVWKSASNAAEKSDWPWLITTRDRIFARILPEGTFVQKDSLVGIKTQI